MRNFLQDHPFTSGIKYDKEFITCSLDLLSGLTECFDSGIETLVLASSFGLYGMFSFSVKFIFLETFLHYVMIPR